MAVKCERCTVELEKNDIYNHHGKELCEDCYMGALQPPKTCDVAATSMAKKHRESTGQRGTEGLLDIQKNIYNYIKKNVKATRDDIMKEFDIPEWELDKQIAILRHCELVKGRKEDGKIYMVLFDY